MAPSTELPAGEPLGFPRCQKCPYVRVGPARICVDCASTSLEPIVPRACPVCRQMLAEDGSCPNWLCDDADRRIERIDAIAYSSGALKRKIHRYKYGGKTGWSLIFGRLLIGWLEAHVAADPPGLIIANPTYLEPGDSGAGHIEAIIRSAAREDLLGRWPFDVQSPQQSSRRSQRSAPPQLRPERNAPQAAGYGPPCARSLSSTTSVPLGASLTLSLVACLMKGARHGSAAWSWPGHPGGQDDGSGLTFGLLVSRYLWRRVSRAVDHKRGRRCRRTELWDQHRRGAAVASCP